MQHQDLLCSCQKASLALAIMGHVGSTGAISPVPRAGAPAHTALGHPSPADQQQPPCSLSGHRAFLGCFPRGSVQSTPLCHFTLDMQVGFPSEVGSRLGNVALGMQ